MTRVICVESIHYDLLQEGFTGTVVLRSDDGPIERCDLTVSGDPTWTYGEASRALSRKAESSDAIARRCVALDRVASLS